jgi:SAM-dependent methyltransferase
MRDSLELSYVHPLLQLANGRELLPPPQTDRTEKGFEKAFKPTFKQVLKRELGRHIYPVKNYLQRGKIMRQLSEIGALPQHPPDLLAWGDKGFSAEIFLKTIRERIGQVETIGCFGCGMGVESIQIARFLKPRKIFAYDYLNYDQAWRYVSDQLKRRGIEFHPIQCDLRRSIPAPERVDALISFAVLEHLHSLPTTFRNLKEVLKPNGWFAAVWGPLWYTFSGDHIAAELGFAHGFDHVLLSPEAYVEWYRTHPRNRDLVARGETTWLEMGLVSFARYADYVREITRSFGCIKWEGQAISVEAFDYMNAFPDAWAKMLIENPQISSRDLILKHVAVLASDT